MRTRGGLIFHPFLFLSTFPIYFVRLTVMNNHSIDAQQDGLVDWPYKVIFQVMSPIPPLRSAVQRLLQFSHHQGEQVSAQFKI